MRNTKTFVLFFIGVMSLFLAGCSSSGTPVFSGNTAELSQVEPAPYQLGSGDQLRVMVFGAGELSGQFVVGPRGNVAYPLLGDIAVGGLTVEEFTTKLEGLLKPDYVRNPQITVEVLNYRPFYVLGEVQQPGTFEFVNGLTVMSAVALAGGFTYRADSRRVFIKHDGELNEQSYELTGATPVQPGDTIRIPERRF